MPSKHYLGTSLGGSFQNFQQTPPPFYMGLLPPQGLIILLLSYDAKV